MSSTFASRALCTRERVLADGRPWGFDLVAFDDHGTVVGHVHSTDDAAIVPAWRGSGLGALLARELEEA
jgi:GNAT superfamily N-acetyltransferase